MNIMGNLKIIGSGKYLPSNKVSSSELEKVLGLRQGWSEKFSGVTERYHVVNETNADLAVRALKEALSNANLELSDIDFLISASATYDYILPFQAAHILKSFSETEVPQIPSMDINTSCLSFISSFEQASMMLQSGKYKRIAIVSAEISSIGLNPDNKETATLFGDGAAAIIVENDETNTHGVYKYQMKTYPEGFDYSIIKGGGNKFFFKDHPYDPNLHSFSMQGKRLLRLAKKLLPVFIDDFFDELEISINDIDVIIPHQASKAGLAIFNHLYPEANKSVYTNLKTHGNCIAASIPMALDDAIKKGILKRGQTCILMGTAAGFAIGCCLFKY